MILKQDSLIYGGAYSQITQSLEFQQNDLEFQLSSFHVMDGTPHLYSYKLNGQSDKWSNWSDVSQTRYTNLKNGEYVFQAKSKNMYGVESKLAQYSFTISPPWYETGWYYLSQALFFVLLISVTFLFSRGSSNQYSEVLILITVITMFEFVILLLEPYVESYANGVPLFKLGMNILLALSLHPMERFLRKVFKRRRSKAVS